MPFVPIIFAMAVSTGHPSPDPPNEPAQLTYHDGHLELKYDGDIILSGDFGGIKTVRSVRQPVVRGDRGQIDQVFAITVDGEATFDGGVNAGWSRSFPCESDRPDSEAPNIVRHAWGKGTDLRNNAVYSRSRDWLLSFERRATVVPTPLDGDLAHQPEYRVSAKGSEIIVRFRPRYYSVHRGLKFFAPWERGGWVWEDSVVGWCSWFAYFQDISEEKVKQAADVLGEKLVPFGLKYLQIDDGYQRDPVGFSDTWLTPNAKFPSGLKSLAGYIKGKGLSPGIWSYTSFHKEDDVQANPDLFVRGTDGKPAYGRWVGYSPDGSNPDAIAKIVKPLYDGYMGQGWEYFKVDSLRHLRYEGYNSHPEFFAAKGADRVDAYRNVVKAIRAETMGKFLLACWGARPELAGLVDGCRIGGDGFSFAGLPQFNSFNNVVWRNDPDHIVLSPEEAYRSCLVTSLTGSLFMVTDKPERYAEGDLEAVKRCIPVLFTQPGQVYDVDPTRTSQLGRVDSEVSGDGPRPFDAGGRPASELFQLDCTASWGSWVVLGRVPVERNAGSAHIPFHDLGLASDKTYHVFEFWTKRYLGAFSGGFDTGAVDAKFGCQCFCVRPVEDRPQILATSRHVSCGAVDVVSLEWAGDRLTGASHVVPGDPYTVTVWEPEGKSAGSVSCEGAQVLSSKRTGRVYEFTLLSKSRESVRWTVSYAAGR